MDIKSCPHAELSAQFAAWGEPAYRLTQVLDWLYRQRVSHWDAMSNVPKSLREKLAGQYSLWTPTLVKVQGDIGETQKMLWRLGDGALIESVVLRANTALYGEPSDRRTLCVSTQVGCAYGCKFCASGLGGWKRNLQPVEIVEQVLAAERWLAEQPGMIEAEGAVVAAPPGPGAPENSPPGREAPGTQWPQRFINNLVIMGMGEPLANYEALLKALHILNAAWGAAIGARKITISTSGLAPQIRQLAAEPNQFRLAISLHGATDLVRDRLMPVNRKHPLAELIQACEYYISRKGKMISLEYILLAGMNDELDQVPPLAEIARCLHAKINLIPYNPVAGLPWKRPPEARQQAFLAALEAKNVPVTLRMEKGSHIDAACGQLRLITEQQNVESA